MRTRIAALLVAVGLLCTPSAIGSRSHAQAADTAIAISFKDIAFAAPTASCPAAVATYTLTSLDGSAIGTGTSCVQSFTGNCPEVLFVGCRQIESTFFTYNLARGSVTVRASKIVQIGTSANSLVESGNGRVISGTGMYAHAKGRMLTAGSLTFFADHTDSTLVHVLTFP